MKTTIITILGLLLALVGTFRLQATAMAQPMARDADMSRSQTMPHDARMMVSGSMEMQHADKTMQAEAMMKPDDKAMPSAPAMIPGEKELLQRLTPLQYQVTREDGTEPPFNNAYWNNHAEGLYVDIISGVPLFSSIDKYESGTGWPSFTRPLDSAAIVEKEDRSFFSVRTEVRGKLSDAHLGHVFDDGPPPTSLRYCMNSAALRFIPKADLVKQGYGEYAKLFK